MSTYVSRVLGALDAFDGTLATLAAAAQASPQTPPEERRQIEEAGTHADAAAIRLRRSFELIQLTSLDIVDMQERVQGEMALLANALRALGKTADRLVEHEQMGRRSLLAPELQDALVQLDECAQQVATAVFPSAIKGLQQVNRRLWDFEKLLWKRYTDLLADLVQAGKLDPDQQTTIAGVADAIREGFGRVNELLNTLTGGAFIESALVVREVTLARDALKTHLEDARARMTSAVGRFESIVDEAEDIAGNVYDRLGELRIPIFPTHAQLPIAASVERTLYENLTGVQRFALMNIAARMLATEVAGEPLWAPSYDIQLTRAFPDRIYFRASAALIERVGADAQFKTAPAALHRFRDGSFKQKTFTRGNLQLSFAHRGGGLVDVDADIDLFAGPVSHLFGEVLVNHLTGNTTNQFSVGQILEEQGIRRVAGFEIFTPTVAFA